MAFVGPAFVKLSEPGLLWLHLVFSPSDLESLSFSEAMPLLIMKMLNPRI